MAGSGRLVDYLGAGTAAARPSSLTLVPGGLGVYWSTDTTTLSTWDGSAWTNLATGGMSNPMTAVADIIVGGTSGTPTRLSGGTDGYVLTMVSGAVAWAASASGFANPMTTAGDMIIGGASGAPARFAAPTTGTTWNLTYVIGTGYVWSSSAATVAWGGITGTLSDQTDLQSALDAKAGKAQANAFTQQQAVTPYRANITGAVSIDLSATAKSNKLILTLTGNVSSFALTNPVDGASYSITFIQDATGGRTLPSPLNSAFKFSGGTQPTWTTTANARDKLVLDYDGTASIYECAQLPSLS